MWVQRVYEAISESMMQIVNEDECNDTYGRMRMYQALKLKHKDDDLNIPGERTVYRIMNEIGLTHKPRRKPNGITKADKLARKSDDLFKRDFKAMAPNQKAVTDITEIKASDGKLYISAMFDCFDAFVLGLAIDDNMKAGLSVNTINNAVKMYPEIRGIKCHSDRGSQYTSELYRAALRDNQIIQRMNSAGGRYHDNARCESMWARMKEELFYSRNRKSEHYTRAELKTMIWRYYMSYWNNRRICSANDGLPPAVKRSLYEDGVVVEEWVSYEHPHFIEAQLIAGKTYTLKETIAPDGYTIANSIDFTVNEDGTGTAGNLSRCHRLDLYSQHKHQLPDYAGRGQ